MLSDLIQMPFEWFVTLIWERHGPLVGILAGFGFLMIIAGAAFLAIEYLPYLFAQT